MEHTSCFPPSVFLLATASAHSVVALNWRRCNVGRRACLCGWVGGGGDMGGEMVCAFCVRVGVGAGVTGEVAV
eukprot:1160297-Pelagomonas_calceolata.AAC.8